MQSRRYLFNPITEIFIQSNHGNIYSISKYSFNPITEIFIQSNHKNIYSISHSYSIHSKTSLLRSRSGRSHVTLPVPTRLLQTDIHSFLGVLRFCLLGPMSLSFSCHCIRCTNHRREHSQQNESHTLIGLFPRKECMSVWSSRVGTGSVTWLRPERLRRRLLKNIFNAILEKFIQSSWGERGQYKTWTADRRATDYGLGIKNRLGYKTRTSITDWV